MSLLASVSLGISVPAALVLLLLAVRRWRADNRRLSIGVLAAIAGYFAIEAVLSVVAGALPAGAGCAGLVWALPLMVLPVFVVVLAAYLLAKGLRIVQRDGRSLANALSLAGGLVVLAVPVIAAFALPAALSAQRGEPVARAVSLGVIVAVALWSAYAAAFFVLFLVYGAVYRRARVGGFDAIVVLGAGLVDGRVPPLLGSRLDRAVALFHARRATGADCVLIPTGGQGDGEPRPEGEAMAEYLRRAGVPPGRVLAETEARNTEENLLFSRRVAEAHRPGSQVLIVTSDYHVLRAAMLARRVGLPSAATGARAAGSSVPSATVREFAAVAAMFPRVQVVAGGLCLLAGLVAGVLVRIGSLY